MSGAARGGRAAQAALDPDAIPAELKAYPQWICWKWGRVKADGRREKPPVSPRTGIVTGHDAPGARTTFGEAVTAVGRYGLGGVSFVVDQSDPFVFVDFDLCRDQGTGEITKPWVRDWLQEANTYAEVSPSGTGIRAVARGTVPRTINTEEVEMYGADQQLTVTGHLLGWLPPEVGEAQSALTRLFSEHAGKANTNTDLKIDESEPPVRLSEYGLLIWRGEKPVFKEDDPSEVDRSATLFKIGCTLAEAGATARIIRSAVADRDVALSYRKYLDRPDGRAEREYARIAVNATGRTDLGLGSVTLVEDEEVPSVFGASWLLREEFPPIRWVVPGILPEGVTILAGKPKLGKSWLAMDLCLGVAFGGAVLGTKRVEGGPCLYLALEDSPRRLQRRLRSLMAGGSESGGEDAPEGFEFATAWPRVGEGCEERLRAWLEAHPRARLVVIDTLKKIRPKADVRKGVYDADYEALEPLLPLAAEFGVAVVVVHHTRKTPGADPLEEVSGSFGLSGGVDGVLVMRRERGSRDAALHVTGRDVEEEAELALRWDAPLVRWTLLGDAEEHRRSEERKQILAKLGEVGEPMSATDVAVEIEKKVDGVRKLIRKMVRDGELAKVGEGSSTRYALPEVVMEDDEAGEEDGR